MDNMNDDDIKSFWPNNEELGSYFADMSVCGYYDSSSPEGGVDLSAASKNIVSERNRRKKLNERLYALRAVVPNISKMDKASIIKDAIEYIESLNNEERRIQAEILELESGGAPAFYLDHQAESTAYSASQPIKRSRTMENYYDSCVSSTSAPSSTSYQLPPSSSPIDLLELRVSNMGEKTIVVSLTCSKGPDTMVKLCDIFESLNLRIITANITAFSGRLLKTVFVEGDDEDKDVLNFKIRAAIAALNDPYSPVSI
ncbi:transcription factor bHLH35-like isoform X1 [Salvia hispanica]|uniref:transcription factor bHLH35-like isoform X1 n=2 Tax=Salvia hispanica TaxID=49212 RepID=UPI0020091E31|nr:transcription factor bHLH35-like isoform X1 [Salvia hispanica]